MCPLDSFNSPLEGHSMQDMAHMFADAHDRRMHAAEQMCDIYQPGIQLRVANAQQRRELLEGANAAHEDRIIVVLRDPGFLITYVLTGELEFRVTQTDEVTNTK
jgi:hypothetical protein